MMLALTRVINRNLIEMVAGDHVGCNLSSVCATFARFPNKQQLVIYKQTAGCWITAGMGNIRPARPFHVARRHLQRHKLRSRIKPKTFFAHHRRSVLRADIVPCPPLTLLFSKKEQN